MLRSHSPNRRSGLSGVHPGDEPRRRTPPKNLASPPSRRQVRSRYRVVAVAVTSERPRRGTTPGSRTVSLAAAINAHNGQARIPRAGCQLLAAPTTGGRHRLRTPRGGTLRSHETRGVLATAAHQHAEPPMSTGKDLNSAVADSIANIEMGVTAYVFGGQRAAYRTVATELRKLLLDPNTARSFGASSRTSTLLGLAFGRLDQIDIQSMKPGSVNDTGWVDVGPPLYPDSRAILQHARGLDQRISLRDWMSESAVTDANGAARRTDRALKDIADKEGAHSIHDWGGKDWRSGTGVAVTTVDPGEMTMDEVESLPYGANWEQFVIMAGASLLYARKREQGRWAPMFDAAERLPEVDGAAGTLQIQRRP